MRLGASFGVDFEPLDFAEGPDGNVRILTSNACIVIHNHPDGLTFSGTDVSTFMDCRNLELLTAVGNNGAIYTLRRTSTYKPMLFHQAWRKEQRILGNTGSPQEYAAEMARFLKEAEKYGIEYTETRINS